jgi:hypothetical protein
MAATLLVAELTQSLKVVVEHARMADQTHLFGSLDVARSDQSATPRADDVIRKLRIPGFIGLRIYVLAHTEKLDKSRSSFCRRNGINDES